LNNEDTISTIFAIPLRSVNLPYSPRQRAPLIYSLGPWDNFAMKSFSNFYFCWAFYVPLAIYAIAMAAALVYKVTKL
jgi:hypothetical protein